MFQRQQRFSHRAARLYPVLLIAIALIVFAVPAVASAMAFSEVALSSRWGPHIYGQEHSPLALVRVTVADSEGIQKGSAESSVSVGGHYMFFEDDILAMDGQPIELRRGDQATITIGSGGSAVAETIIAELAALCSSTQDKVYIEALPNQNVAAYRVADTSFEYLTQGMTSAEGKLVLNLTIPPNELFYIMSADDNANFASIELWPAYGMVDINDEVLLGSGFISDSTATVEVYSGSSKLAEALVVTASDGSFLAHDFSPEIDIVSGNKIKIVSRYETTQFIANLEADMDYVDDTILGKTTPDSFLVARIAPTADPSSSFDETAAASSGGAFAINAVMDSGDSVWLASIHPDGNITQMHREFGTSSSSHGNPVIFANKQNQHAAAISIEELGPRSISAHAGANKLTLEIKTDGVTFSSPPQATCDGVALDGESAALSSDRRTATWTVSECTTQTTGSIMIDDISYDADTSTPDGDVLLAVGGNSGVTAELVSNAVAINDLSVPTTTVTVDPEIPNGKNGWYITAPTITSSATATATVFYRWDDGVDTVYTMPLVATEGESTLTAYAIDIDDDVGASVSRLFKVDTVVPTTPVLNTVNTITASNVTSVTVGGFAETDTVVHITASDGINTIETTTTSGGTFNMSLDLSSLEDTNTVVFTAQAEDEAGNKSEVDSTIALKDTAPPEVDSTNPENGATGVDTDTAVISVTFSEFIETGTAFGGITLGYDGTTMSVSALIDSDTVNIPLDGPLAYETTYTVTIPATAVKDGVGNEFAADYIFSFTTEKDIIPPTWSPTSTFTASEIGQTSVKLSWAGASDTVGVTGFRIYSGIGTVLHATVGAAESTTITGLTPGTQYTFTIQARDAAGNWSGGPSCGPSVTVTTTSSGGGGGGGGGGISDPVPSAPKSLKVISTQNMIRLGWTANTESDLSGYNIYRKVKDASGSSTKLNPTHITGVEYEDTTAQLGVVYIYYVTAVDNGNNESQKSNEVEASRIGVLAEDIFFDVRAGDWFASFVSRLNSLNIIGGYPDKSFRPHQNLTRAEFAKMLCLAMGWELQGPSTPYFNDVARAHWSYRYVETAKARGALGGYPNGEFRPNNSITRAEIAAAIARALNLSAGSSDLTDIALHWAKDHISACVKAGIISGYPGNVFRPNANATRAEASKMIAGVLDNK